VGSYLALEMLNPQFDSAGNCMATFLLLQSTGGTVTSLAGFPHSCRNGMVVRLALHGGTALVWPDESTPMEFGVTPSGSGQPGIGIAAAPSGNSISQVELGAIDRTAPLAVSSQSIGVAAFRTRTDVQWQAVSLNSNGSGLDAYFIYRDGNYLLRTAATSFSDETVRPGDSHTYTIYTVSQHWDQSPAASITVASPVPAPPTSPPTPPPGADSGNGMDPRRIGVRALATYWGGAGEQVDTDSGNVNFSVPLITAKSRGGWSVQFVLSYNSQMWRQDSSGPWLLEQDMGYGQGWKLQAGSIVPIWNTSTIDHYLYTDATGAEYSLSVNTNNVWTSIEGTYVSFNSNAQKLYFTDGSFWVMGSISQEPADQGTLYPTSIEDSNGNQLS
jgi:hypothetical protein